MYYEQYQILSEKVNLMLLLIIAQDKTRVYTFIRNKQTEISSWKS